MPLNIHQAIAKARQIDNPNLTTLLLLDVAQAISDWQNVDFGIDVVSDPAEIYGKIDMALKAFVEYIELRSDAKPRSFEGASDAAIIQAFVQLGYTLEEATATVAAQLRFGPKDVIK